MVWQSVLDAIDAIESWVAAQSYWIQVVLLLGVLVPLCYLLAGFIDRVVDAALAMHGHRDQPADAAAEEPPGASTIGSSAGTVP